jgi:hypothetical protein
MGSSACLRLHRAFIRLPFIGPLVALFCDECDCISSLSDFLVTAAPTPRAAVTRAPIGACQQ